MKFPWKKIVKYAVVVLIITGIAAGGYFAYNKVFAANTKSTANARTVKVTRGDMNVTITGTGTVQPISKYDIVPLVQGNIISAPFDEGMKVKSGDLLYKIDDSDLSYNIQKSQDSVNKLQISNQQSEDSAKDYEVVAPVDGRLTNFTLNLGDQVGNNGKIGDIVDEKHVKATVQFSKSQIDKITMGDKAQLLVPDFMEYLDGTVTNISNSAKPNTDGAVVCDVDITIDNPGGISSGLSVTGIIKTSSGDIESPYQGTTSYVTNQSLTSQTAGKVKQIFVQNNDWVHAGQKILTFDTSDINSTIQKNSLDIKDAQISLDAQEKQLNNYNILSPIDGTVIAKNYKAGDTIGVSSDSKVLMTVADLSKMVFTMAVDELDISKIAVGQKVSITADALPGTTFEGDVTSVPLSGTTSNGVTTYSVEVTISNPGKLLPGMNVNAEIQVQTKKDVLYLPIAAVTKVGDKAYVFVPGANTSNASGKNQGASAGSASNQSGSQQRNQQSGQQGYQRNGSNSSQGGSQRSGGNSNRSGFNMSNGQRKEVQLGINNDDNIEIVSGLNEGDTVLLPSTSSSTSSGNTQGKQVIMGGGMGITGGAIGGGQRRGN